LHRRFCVEPAWKIIKAEEEEEMASKSSQYLTRNRHDSENSKTSGVSGKTALIHSIKIDLDPLLISTESGIERIPLIYFHEGKA
jgi:hypothetical protein